MIFTWCKDPAGNPIDLRAIDVTKRCEPVIAVENFKVAATKHCDERSRNGFVFSNEGCTCPKPLLSVLEVCRHCLSVRGAVGDYLVGHQDAHGADGG